MPCPSGVASTGKLNERWISSFIRGASRNMKIAFSGKFKDLTRLTRLEIEWEVAPVFVSIQYTVDGTLWFDLMSESKLDTLNDPNN
jgi:hypothetical protein